MLRPALSDRRLRIFVLAAIPLAFGLLSVALGQDSNWDLRNYHWYNAYAWLAGRIGFDILPAQIPSFYNPALDIPFYLLANALPTRLTGFLVGAFQGLNGTLLVLLADRLLTIADRRRRLLTATAIALVGMLGGGAVAQLGTTFDDNTAAIGITASLLLVVHALPVLTGGSAWQAAWRALIAGLPVGAAMGLKEPTVIYGVALCAALLAVPGPVLRRIANSFWFGIGVLVAIAATDGFWMVHLWHAYGDPLFPFFNSLFHSPYAAISDYRDKHFIPASPVVRLLYPFFFALHPTLVGEISFREFAVPLLFAALPAALAVRLVAGRPTQPIADPAGSRYVLLALAVAYVLWVVLFCIYRYLVPLEMLAPLGLVLTAGLLPIPAFRRWQVAWIVLILLRATSLTNTWERVPWTRNWVEATMPTLPDPAHTMVLLAGYQPLSYLIPLFPHEIPFVRIESNFVQPDQSGNAFNAVIRARIAAHRGPFFVMSTVLDTRIAGEAALAYGLTIDLPGCQVIHTNLGEPLSFCPLRRGGGQSPAAGISAGAFPPLAEMLQTEKTRAYRD